MPARPTGSVWVNEVVDAGRLLNRAVESVLQMLEAPLDALRTTKEILSRIRPILGFEESFSIEHDKAFQEFLLRKAVQPQK